LSGSFFLLSLQLIKIDREIDFQLTDLGFFRESLFFLLYLIKQKINLRFGKIGSRQKSVTYFFVLTFSVRYNFAKHIDKIREEKKRTLYIRHLDFFFSFVYND